MDKSLLIFILIGIGALYLVTDFIGAIQAEDDAYKNGSYKTVDTYEQYQKVDSVGQPILSVEGAEESIQIAAWQASLTKVEFVALFPDFSEMKSFVKDRVKGKHITKKLLLTINDVESKFFSGVIDSEQAKKMLDLLK